MTRWLGRTSLLNGLSLLLLVTGAGATGHQSVAITMDPSRSIVQSHQVTLPVIVTTTAVSVVTVTQMSMQTTTAMITKMETVVLAATCAAPSQAPEPQSSQEVVTAGAFDETATPAVVPSSSAPVPSGSSASSAVKAASSAAPERCDCSCLCPMAAFPMAAYQMAPNTTQAIATSSTQMSTFTTVVTTPVGNLIVVSSVGEPALSSDVKATESTPSTSSTSMDQTMSASTTTPSTSQITTPPTSVSGVLPTEIVTDPGTGNAQVQQKNVLDAPLDIDNYSLMTSVNLPVIVGRAAEPTAAV